MILNISPIVYYQRKYSLYIDAFDPGKQNTNSTTIVRFETFTYFSLNNIILNICTGFCSTKISFFHQPLNLFIKAINSSKYSFLFIATYFDNIFIVF